MKQKRIACRLTCASAILLQTLFINGTESIVTCVQLTPSIIKAIKQNQMPTILTFLNHDPACANACNENNSILGCACKYGNYDLAELLIMRGANVHYKNKNGISLLDMILLNNRTNKIPLLKLVIDNKANVNLWGMDGCPALYRAVVLDLVDEAKFLLDYGKADLFAKNHNGKTVFDYLEHPSTKKMKQGTRKYSVMEKMLNDAAQKIKK